MLYKTQYLEDDLYVRKLSNKRPQKHNFFILQFLILGFSKNFSFSKLRTFSAVKLIENIFRFKLSFLILGFSKISVFQIENIFRCKFKNLAMYQKSIFCIFVTFFETFAEISDPFKLHILREQLMLYKT